MISLLLWGCGDTANSPEVVVERYAQWVHTGQLQQAKALCTPAGIAYLEALTAVITGTDGSNFDSIQVNVESMRCTLGPDQQTAQCEGWIDDGYERFQETYFLQRQGKNWLIDHPTEKGTLQSSEEAASAQKKPN